MIKATKSLPFLFFYIKILRLTMKEYKTVEFENSDEFIEKKSKLQFAGGA